MSIDVMIVAPCKGIESIRDSDFVDWLSDAVEDFSIRYCALSPTQENIDKLREFAAQGESSAQMILEEMGGDAVDDPDECDGVEIFIG